jgi:hypothetical protein
MMGAMMDDGVGWSVGQPLPASQVLAGHTVGQDSTDKGGLSKQLSQDMREFPLQLLAVSKGTCSACLCFFASWLCFSWPK